MHLRCLLYGYDLRSFSLRTPTLSSRFGQLSRQIAKSPARTKPVGFTSCTLNMILGNACDENSPPTDGAREVEMSVTGITGEDGLMVENCNAGETAMQTRASVPICTMTHQQAAIARRTAVAKGGEGEGDAIYFHRKKDDCLVAFATVARHPVGIH